MTYAIARTVLGGLQLRSCGLDGLHDTDLLSSDARSVSYNLFGDCPRSLSRRCGERSWLATDVWRIVAVSRQPAGAAADAPETGTTGRIDSAESTRGVVPDTTRTTKKTHQAAGTGCDWRERKDTRQKGEESEETPSVEPTPDRAHYGRRT